MSDLTATIDTWLDAYAEPDQTRRDELISQAWAPAGILTDPPFAGSGYGEISALATAVLQHYPGHRFRRTSGVDAHHGYARYSWMLVDADGQPAVSGLDVAEVDEDGRLVRVTGFFGDLPTRA